MTYVPPPRARAGGRLTARRFSSYEAGIRTATAVGSSDVRVHVGLDGTTVASPPPSAALDGGFWAQLGIPDQGPDKSVYNFAPITARDDGGWDGSGANYGLCKEVNGLTGLQGRRVWMRVEAGSYRFVFHRIGHSEPSCDVASRVTFGFAFHCCPVDTTITVSRPGLGVVGTCTAIAALPVCTITLPLSVAPGTTLNYVATAPGGYATVSGSFTSPACGQTARVDIFHPINELFSQLTLTDPVGNLIPLMYAGGGAFVGSKDYVRTCFPAPATVRVKYTYTCSELKLEVTGTCGGTPTVPGPADGIYRYGTHATVQSQYTHACFPLHDVFTEICFSTDFTQPCVNNLSYYVYGLPATYVCPPGPPFRCPMLIYDVRQ